MRAMIKAAAAALTVGVIGVMFVSVPMAGAKTQCEAQTKAGSAKYKLCVEGKEMGTEGQTSPISLSSHLKSGASMMISDKLGGAELRVECSAGSASGVFDTENGKLQPESSVRLDYFVPTFSNCSLKEDPSCELSSANLTFTEEVGTLSSLEASTLKPAVQSTLASFTLLNKGTKKCPTGLVGTWYLEGHYECKLASPEVPQSERELACLGNNVYFKFKQEEHATLSFAQEMSLSGTQVGKKFSLFESR